MDAPDYYLLSLFLCFSVAFCVQTSAAATALRTGDRHLLLKHMTFAVYLGIIDVVIVVFLLLRRVT